MNVKNLIAAAVVFAAAAAGSAFAASPADAAAATPATASVGAALLASNLNVPAITINGGGPGRSRAEVRAEAVEFVKNYRTALSVQLDQYKN
jgi:hypothetical protein